MRIIQLALLTLLLCQPLVAADNSVDAAKLVKAGEQAGQAVAGKVDEAPKDNTKEKAEEAEPDCD